MPELFQNGDIICNVKLPKGTELTPEIIEQFEQLADIFKLDLCEVLNCEPEDMPLLAKVYPHSLERDRAPLLHFGE